jgi:hypothetical protein
MNGAVGFTQQNVSKRFRAFRGETLLFVAQLLAAQDTRGAHAGPHARCNDGE